MFDFAWSEIAVIGVVALIAIGPKDMPVAIRTMTNALKKARRMAAEFQTHVDDMVREANLDDVRREVQNIRNFDFKGTVERTVDADGSIRAAFQEPVAAHPPQPVGVIADPPSVALAAHGTETIAAPAEADDAHPKAATNTIVIGWEEEEAEGAPPFIPPAAAEAAPDRPSFVPPDATRASDRPLRF
ncbi:MAG: twin-arginine translocase subunit TatB [Acetobacteraceae bacterium]|nr:twin-arginine translocase subunit TatB [Acetobacteraceae bacterium]